MKKTAFFWFTGLSGAGKTTVANGVQQKLQREGCSVFIIDGDEVRERFHCYLTFSREDIKKNNALIVEMCKENKGRVDVIFVPIISPFKVSRDNAKKYLGEGFYEIYFKVSVEYVSKQDVKGLYAKAQKNIIDDLIGFSSRGVEYDIPANPDFIVQPQKESPQESINKLYDFVMSKLGKKVEISE
ncbi:hypothetical protein MNBD_GAMMA03-469 [hydrothermal vent metagenome]|uniref:adenylyl-sulfate kinase n=1 Tax=hydrothermal vent metagenome TaxID=652676 RepID=A0A3B0W8Y2_9ZZZZ